MNKKYSILNRDVFYFLMGAILPGGFTSFLNTAQKEDNICAGIIALLFLAGTAFAWHQFGRGDDIVKKNQYTR